MMLTNRKIALALLTAALLTGCGERETNEDTMRPLLADVNSPIADVPIPAGFTMSKDEKESFSDVYGNSSLRFVKHHYTGSDNYLMVAKFYREQMPQKKWTLVQQSQEGESLTLTFLKNNEDCIINIRPTSFKTHVRVRILPSARTIR